MELLQRTTERGHRFLRPHPELNEPVVERRKVLKLAGCERRERRLVVDRRGHRHISGRALKGDELPVGEHAEQVDDRRPIFRIGFKSAR